MPEHSYRVATIVNIMWNFSEQLLRKGVSLFVTLMLAWMLVPEDFGLIAMIAVFIELSYIFVNGGLVAALIRQKKLSQLDLDSTFYTNLILSLLAYILIFVSAPVIANFYEQPNLVDILRVVGIAILFQAFSIVPNALMRRKLLFKLQLKVALPSSILSGIAALGFAYFEYGVWALVVQMLVAPFITSVLYWRLRLWLPKIQFSFRSIKSLLGFGGYLVLDNILKVIFNNLIIIIIAKFFPIALLGLYYFASKIRTLVIQQLVDSVHEVTYPVLSKLQEDLIRLKKGYRKVIGITTFVLFPILTLLAVLTPVIFEVMLPEKWLGAAEYLQLMCLIAVFFPISSLAKNVLMARGRSDIILYFGFFTKITMVGVLIVSIDYGIEGILLGQFLNSFIVFLGYSFFIAKQINYSFKEQIFDFLPSLLLSIVMGSLLFWGLNYSELSAFLELFIFGLFGVLFYLTVAYVLKFNSILLLTKLIQEHV